MKTKKSNAPGCFAGGDITSIASLATSLAGSYADAFNYKADPTGDPYKFNLVKGLQGGLISLAPELIKMYKDKNARENYIASATPGRYATGGPIEGIPSQSDNFQKSKNGKKGVGYESSGKRTWRRGDREDGSGELVSMQTFLKNKGFYKGEIDGIYGNQTEDAVREYQKWFNRNAKKEMWYSKDGTNSERIGGRSGKRIAEDGVVGDQTRTALMYREMPEEKKSKKAELVPEFPVGTSTVNYTAEDYTPTDFPDSPMNYSGGAEMLGWALLGMQGAGVGMTAVEADLVGANAARNLTQQGIKSINVPKPVLNPTVPKPLNGIGGRSFQPRTPDAYGTRIGYSKGGEIDEQLSSLAFEVEADPNKVDSKYYPNLNVNLDHGEVVMNNKFVFSNRIDNPKTGKSFAEEAEALQKSVGKAEKILKTNPRDAFANNTINISNDRTKKLAQTQEALASLLGHRDNKPQGMAAGGFTGGPGDPIYTFLGEGNTTPLPRVNISPKGWLDFTNPMDPATGQRRRPLTADSFTGTKFDSTQAAIDLGRDGLFYDPYSNRFTVRNSRGEYVGVQPSEGQFSVTNGVVNDLKSGKKYNINQHLQYMRTPRVQSAGPEGPSLASPSNVLLNTEGAGTSGAPIKTDPLNPFGVLDQLGQPPVASSNTPKPRTGTGRKIPTSNLPTATTSPLDVQSEYDRAMYEEMQAAANRNLPVPAPPTSVKSMAAERGLPDLGALTSSVATATTVPSDGRIYNKFTLGDALQAVEVASKFGQLIGGPDKETPNFDTTRITKETFDPTNAKYQTNRTLQNAINTIEAPSVNMRRNIANSLYAQRLGQDNNIMSEYNRMNQAANTQYEQRAAAQRQYNIGQTNYTEDLNQRNLDTYRNTVQNAFTSLGNFGEALNSKRQGTDALNILRKSYPQVYQRMMEDFIKKG